MFGKTIVMLAIASIAATAHAAQPPVALVKHVPHLAAPAPDLLTGGQPDAAAWKLLADAGVNTVINLRSDEEMRGSDEATRVRAVGMHYVRIPISGAADVSRANAARLDAAIKAAGGKVMIHCASGNRVGALLAIDAADTRHLGADAAVAFGKSAGLTRLEPRVREVLAQKPKP